MSEKIMTRDQRLKMGLALNHIGMSVDDETYKRIKPYLDQIEQVALELTERVDEDCTDAETEQG